MHKIDKSGNHGNYTRSTMTLSPYQNITTHFVQSYDITEIVLKVALSTTILTLTPNKIIFLPFNISQPAPLRPTLRLGPGNHLSASISYISVTDEQTQPSVPVPPIA